MSHEEITRSETRLLRTFKQKREERGITLDEMSSLLQSEYDVTISPTVYAKVESGARKLKTAEIFAIADMLKVDINDSAPAERMTPREFVEGAYRATYEGTVDDAFLHGMRMRTARQHWQVANDLKISSGSPATSIQIERKNVVSLVTDLLDNRIYRPEQYLVDLGVDEAVADDLVKVFTDNTIKDIFKAKVDSSGRNEAHVRQDEAIEGIVDAIDAALPNLTLV